MADILVGDVLRLAVRLLMPDNVEALNVFEFGTLVEGDIAPALVAFSDWMDDVYGALVSVMNQNIELAPSTLTKIQWQVDKWVTTRILGTVVPSVVFTNTDPMTPHAVAGVITYPTVRPKQRGRKFFPGLIEAVIDNSSLNGTAITALQNAALQIITAITATDAGSWVYAIYSSKDGGPSGPSSIEVNSLSGTMRRRKPGVGS